jgi:hypothetical protein
MSAVTSTYLHTERPRSQGHMAAAALAFGVAALPGSFGVLALSLATRESAPQAIGPGRSAWPSPRSPCGRPCGSHDGGATSTPTASGEVRALGDTDARFIEKVSLAITDAILARG